MSSEEQQLSEAAFFQGPSGKGRSELTLPAAAILREVDPQVLPLLCPVLPLSAQ